MSEIEKDEKVQALVKHMKEKYNVYFTSKTLGPLEFRQFGFKEFSKVNALSKESLDEREFAIKLIFGLIVEPKISLDDFHKISDLELISVIRQICDKNENLKKFFCEPVDDRVFTEFKETIRKYNDEKVNELTKMIAAVGIPFNQTIRDMIPPSTFLQNIISQLALPQDMIPKITFPQDLIPKITFPQDMIPKIALPQDMIPKITFPQDMIPKIALSQNIISQTNVLQTWVQLNQGLFDNISRQFKELAESLNAFDTTIENANKILKKYKWFVSLSLPDSFYGAALNIEKSGTHKRKRINRLFIDYFSTEDYKALEELVEEWKDNPHFKPRMKVFRTCIKTLKRAKRGENPSIIVIPVLIAQIDGIMNEIVAKYNIKQDPATNMWIDGKGNQSKKKKEAERKLIASLNEYSPLGEYLLLEILFQQSIPELSVPTTFSRHKILHGEYLNYGRIDNTIRSFLILDFLHYLEGV